MYIIILASSGFGDNFANDSNFSSFSDNAAAGGAAATGGGGGNFGNQGGGQNNFDNNLSYGGSGRGILIEATRVFRICLALEYLGYVFNCNDIVTLWGDSVLLSHPSVIPNDSPKPYNTR